MWLNNGYLGGRGYEMIPKILLSKVLDWKNSYTFFRSLLCASFRVFSSVNRVFVNKRTWVWYLKFMMSVEV